MRLIIFLFSLNVLFFQSVFALTQDAYPFTSQTEANRFQTLTKEVRCVVCQNQSIADSNALLANDLREKIYKMILEKKSNDEIKNYLTKRYGDFILLQPRFNQLTFLLWLFPFIALLLIGVLFKKKLK